jgi:hypothetical protein
MNLMTEDTFLSRLRRKFEIRNKFENQITKIRDENRSSYNK